LIFEASVGSAEEVVAELAERLVLVLAEWAVEEQIGRIVAFLRRVPDFVALARYIGAMD
jgi:hypothetical protein